MKYFKVDYGETYLILKNDHNSNLYTAQVIRSTDNLWGEGESFYIGHDDFTLELPEHIKIISEEEAMLELL